MDRYTGPVILPTTREATLVYPCRFVYTATGASSGSGVISLGASSIPNSAQDWASFTALFSEFRTIAVRAEWVPLNVGFSGTTVPVTQGQLVIWKVRGGAAAVPGSLQAAYDNDGAKAYNVGQRFAEEIRMDGTPSANWTATTSPSVATFGIGLYGTGFANSTTYGTWFVDLLVQLRSRF